MLEFKVYFEMNNDIYVITSNYTPTDEFQRYAIFFIDGLGNYTSEVDIATRFVIRLDLKDKRTDVSRKLIDLSLSDKKFICAVVNGKLEKFIGDLEIKDGKLINLDNKTK